MSFSLRIYTTVFEVGACLFLNTYFFSFGQIISWKGMPKNILVLYEISRPWSIPNFESNSSLYFLPMFFFYSSHNLKGETAVQFSKSKFKNRVLFKRNKMKRPEAQSARKFSYAWPSVLDDSKAKIYSWYWSFWSLFHQMLQMKNRYAFAITLAKKTLHAFSWKLHINIT